MERQDGYRQKTGPRLERLRKNSQFKRVYREGKSVATGRTVLFFRKNEVGPNRLGISVSKKVGKSVVRNRLKRLYREAFKQLKGEMKEGFDLVIIARRTAPGLDFYGALREIRKLLVRGNLKK